jgi:hypothetical protein
LAVNPSGEGPSRDLPKLHLLSSVGGKSGEFRGATVGPVREDTQQHGIGSSDETGSELS